MRRKLILKFDVKAGSLRVHVYKAESIRVQGECLVDMFDVTLSKGYAKVVLDKLLLKLNDEFDIGFKVNNIGNIRNWVKQNIFKIYIRENIPSLIEEAIIKTISDGTIIIKD